MTENDAIIKHNCKHLEPHQWRKGESGNPLGRKPRARACDAFAEILGRPVDDDELSDKTKLTALCEKVYAQAMSGCTKSAELIFKYVEPKVPRVDARTVNVIGGEDSTQPEIHEFLCKLPYTLAAGGCTADQIFATVREAELHFGGNAPNGPYPAIPGVRCTAAQGNERLDALLRACPLPPLPRALLPIKKDGKHD